jgi:hypothetical protein
MYLKGALLKRKTKTLGELKHQLGHSLPKCWDAFKAQVNDPGLNRFDAVVAEIHKYEELRYPDRYPPVMNSMFDVVRSTLPLLPGVEVPSAGLSFYPLPRTTAARSLAFASARFASA